MAKIVMNQGVIDDYRKGMSLNEAIMNQFGAEITDRIQKDPTLKDFKPFDFVTKDAGISKYSNVGEIMNTAYQSAGMESNEWLFPAFVEQTVREKLYSDDILGYVCDTTVPVDGNIIKAPTLDLLSKNNKKAVSMMRIAEGADLPTGKITMGETAVNLWKHGRAIEMTYEAVRRMKIPLFQRQMNAILGDIAHQNLNAAVEVLYNGDGNANSKATQIAVVETLSALTPEKLVSALIDYYMENHYVADTMVMGKEAFKKLAGLTYDKNLAAGANMNLSFNMPQLQGKQNITILCADTPKVGSSHDGIMLSNRSMALTRYEENGSNIQENQNFARNQTQLLTVSENSGYAIQTIGANRYIEINSLS